MNRYTVTVNGKRLEVGLLKRAGALLNFEVDGKSYDVDVAPILERAGMPVASAPQSAPRAAAPKASAAPGSITAPMPGIIVSLAVKEGDQVQAGQTVAVIEAMKMENNIPAPSAGKVTKIHVKAGQEVQNGAALLTLS